MVRGATRVQQGGEYAVFVWEQQCETENEVLREKGAVGDGTEKEKQ